MKVGVIGYGIIGQATASLFQNVVVYDPYKGYHDTSVLSNCDLVFVCVPTPTVNGHSDLTTLQTVLGEVIPQLSDQVVCIRSTTLPGTTRNFQQRWPQTAFAYNPEFLRAHCAFEDAIKPYRVVVGVDAKWIGDIIVEAYRTSRTCIPRLIMTDSTTAEMIKYAANCFLAMKITYANEIFDACNALGINYEQVRQGISLDPRIGDGDELTVNPDYRGFRDECLPKDLDAFISFLTKQGFPLQIFDTIRDINYKLLNGTPKS
jgi:UDPglucose 6-dehydrogenase